MYILGIIIPVHNPYIEFPVVLFPHSSPTPLLSPFLPEARHPKSRVSRFHVSVAPTDSNFQ